MTTHSDHARDTTTQASLKDLAPSVFRQRLLVEGSFGGAMTEARVRTFLLDLARALDLRTYGDPVVFQPDSGMGKAENAGFDAFVPLIDSGISAYFWTAESFASILIYTCKGFDTDTAVGTTRELLQIDGDIVSHGF